MTPALAQPPMVQIEQKPTLAPIAWTRFALAPPGSGMIGTGVNLSTQYSINYGTVDYFGASLGGVYSVGAAAGDFATFAASSTAASTFLARTSSFTKADNVNYNSILSGMNSDGDLALTDALYVLAAPTSAASLLNLISTSLSLTSHGTSTFTARTGIAGDGTTGYFDTGYVSSTAGLNLKINLATLMTYDRTNRTGVVAGVVTIGATDNTTLESAIYPITRNGSTDYPYASVNDYTGVYAVGTTSQGLTAVNRSGGTTETLFKNGVSIDIASVATVGLPPYSFYLLAENEAATAGSWTSDQVSAALIGGNVNVPHVSQRINSFMQAYGINVY